MLVRAVRAVVASAALLIGAPAIAAAQTRAIAGTELPFEETLADVTTRLCVDVLSGKTALPPPGAPGWFAGYGLTEGMPKEAMDALSPQGIGLIAQATLASGSTKEGAFVVALGGAAGETCRILVYRATVGADLANRTSGALATKARGWRTLPASPQYAAANKVGLLVRRDGKPYLANLLTPSTGGPVVMAIVVAAVPPQVTLPSGY